MNSFRKYEDFSFFLGVLSNLDFSDRPTVDSIIGLLNYTCISLNRADAYSLYKARRDTMAKTELQRSQFDNVLHLLSQYSGERVSLHMIKIENCGFFFFMGEDVKCSLGVITFVQNE